MAIPVGGGQDFANPIVTTEAAPVYGGEAIPGQTWGASTLGAANAVSPAFESFGSFNIAIWGTFSGTVTLQKTYDNGTNWIPAAASVGGVATAVTFTAPATLSWTEVEQGVQYRLQMNAYTSGAASYRLSGGNALYFTPNPTQ